MYARRYENLVPELSSGIIDSERILAVLRTRCADTEEYVVPGAEAIARCIIGAEKIFTEARLC